MNKGIHFVKKREIVYLLVFLTVSVILFFLIKGYSRNGDYAEITCGDTVYTLDLRQSGEFTFDECPDTVFLISDGKIQILESACKDRICIKTGAVGSQGQSIICIPQKISVTIISNENKESSADAIIG